MAATTTTDPQLTNVLQEFRRAFPTEAIYQPMLDSLESMPLDSTCGDDCAAVINAAQSFLKHIDQAYGRDRPHFNNQLAAMTASICQTYITG